MNVGAGHKSGTRSIYNNDPSKSLPESFKSAASNSGMMKPLETITLLLQANLVAQKMYLQS